MISNQSDFHFSYLMIFLFCSFSLVQADQIFVSPHGNDDNNGLSTGSPMRSISAALAISGPGDEIRLLPGVYTGTTYISARTGEPENPLIITGHYQNPDSMAVIDGQVELVNGLSPDGGIVSDMSNYAFEVRNSSWIIFENFKFINCWAHVIVLRSSSYITVRKCDIRSGMRAIYVRDHSHHVLVEDNYWELDQRVWDTWDWASLHHGVGGDPPGVVQLSHFNGALLHTKESGGSLVMRRNVLKNIFNGYRTKPTALYEGHNVEIYDNQFINVRDNVLEPEVFAYNLHFYHNRIYNSHKSFSIDDVTGGLIYIYGNVQTQEENPVMGPHVAGGEMDGITGIWKFKSPALLTEPCYAFNNSFYTHATAFLEGEGTNHMMKHFNNVYEFFSSAPGSGTMGLTDWDPSFEFNFDAINESMWPPNIITHSQEKNGILTDTLFVDGLNGNLHLKDTSPCIDAGRIMSFPELSWSQSFSGTAPDLGAYEDHALVEGPPFRYIEPPGGAGYQDKPRIVRHYVNGNKLTLYFSSPIDPASIRSDEITLMDGSEETAITGADFPRNNCELILIAENLITDPEIQLHFKDMPVGENGQFATSWASTLPIIAESLAISAVENPMPVTTKDFKIEVYPNPSNSVVIFKMDIIAGNNKIWQLPLTIYDMLGRKVKTLFPQKSPVGITFRLESGDIASGVYIASFYFQSYSRAIKFTVLR